MKMAIFLIVIAVFFSFSQVYAFEPLFDTRVEYKTEFQPIAIYTNDLNTDGYADMAAVCFYDSLSVYLGNGDGTFQPMHKYYIGDGPISSAEGDFNNDGFPDFAVVNQYSQNIAILFNDRHASFLNRQIYDLSLPRYLCTGDFDNDGNLDLAVTFIGHGPDEIDSLVFLNNIGDGNFEFGSYLSFSSRIYNIKAEDINNDNDPDILVQAAMQISCYLNAGMNNFNYSASYEFDNQIESFVLQDINNDNFKDIIASIYQDSVIYILLNSGDGLFQSPMEYPLNIWPYSISCVDMNYDGNYDLLISAYSGSTYSNQILLYLNDGNSNFHLGGSYDSDDDPISLQGIDIDGDNDKDIIFADYRSQYIAILFNKGDLRFASYPKYFAESPMGVKFADLDLDGNLDIAIANTALDSISILVNNDDGDFEV